MHKKIKKYLQDIKYATKIIFLASNKFFFIKIILSVTSSFIPFLPLLFFRRLINSLVDFISQESNSFIEEILIFTSLYCFALLLQKIIDIISNIVTFKYNDMIEFYIDNIMIEKVSSVDLAFFDSSDLNDKMNNSWSLIFSMKSIVTLVFDTLQAAVRLIISFSLMMSLSFWLIPVVIFLCIPSIIGDKKNNDANYLFEKEYTKTHRKLEYYKNLFFAESRNDIRLYNLKEHFLTRYKNVWVFLENSMYKKDVKLCLTNCVVMIMLTGCEIAGYIISISKMIAKEIAVGDITYYISLLTQFRSDFTSLCYCINKLEKNSKELSDVRSFIEMKPILEKSGTLNPRVNPVIEFKNVSFCYPNSNFYVLQNCSFKIEPGETIGLVGLNGSGKSTIVKLLCRFYDPTEGQILIDGIDNKEYDISKLRTMFGVLFQDYVKYSFSLRENIALSQIENQNDNKKIIDSCNKSGLTKIIHDWEKGVDENLTRRFDPKGKELSGGQWQSVAIARTFFRDSSVIILDEPSASLDPIAEHYIFDQFSKLSHNKSTLLISHRLSSILLANKILLLSKGRIVEQGSHMELLKKDGEYAKLFKLQASKYTV